MAKTKELKIRPYLNESQQRTDWRDQTIIYVSYDVLKDFKLRPGGRCLIKKADSSSPAREAVVCTAREVTKSVVLMSRAFQTLCGLTLGDSVVLSAPSDGFDVPVAETIQVNDVTVMRGVGHGADGAAESPSTLAPASAQVFTALLKANSFRVAGVLTPGMVFSEQIKTLGKRSFSIVAINGQDGQVAHFDNIKSVVSLGSEELARNPAPRLEITAPVIAQQDAVRELNCYLAEYGRSPDMCSLAMPQSCGLVIDGPVGSGKNDMVDKIIATGWGTRYDIYAGDSVSTIRQTFAQAREQQPSIVVIRDFETDNKVVINVFADFLDKLSADVRSLGYVPRVLVLATCVDYVSDIPAKLRTQSRFNHVVTLRIPNKEGRCAILKSLDLPFPPGMEDECMEYLLDNTFGWTAGDIYRLVDKALYRAKLDQRNSADLDTSSATTAAVSDGKGRKVVQLKHLFSARQAVRPATMDGVDARPPKVQWSDIGGYEQLKEFLAHAVKLMTDPSQLVEPPRGILLYGPPGCSKTMAAQAMATAARCNFFAIKGGELLNKYVGESERNVRQLFERARRAAPSIIFFDELDAIGGGRATMGQWSGGGRSGGGGGGGGGGDSSGVKIIQALLTEIDGFETQSGVMVVGATNRPDLIDAALMRPGRFDQLYYVGPPNAAARQVILKRLVSQRAEFAAEDLMEKLPEYVSLTEGFSGAEITQVWRNCLLNVSRESQSAGALLTSGTGDGAVESKKSVVTAGDLTQAIAAMDKQITPDILEGYDNWRRRFQLAGTA